MAPTVTINDYLPFLAMVFGGGVGVTLVAQLVKRVFGLNSSHVVHLMVVAVSIAAAAAQYVLTLKGMPPEVLGISSVAIYGFSQAVYNESKLINSFLSQVQVTYSAGKAQLAAANVDAAVAAVNPPAEVAAEQTTSTDFNA